MQLRVKRVLKVGELGLKILGGVDLGKDRGMDL